jgi:hypothetical protein
VKPGETLAVSVLEPLSARTPRRAERGRPDANVRGESHDQGGDLRQAARGTLVVSDAEIRQGSAWPKVDRFIQALGLAIAA